MIPVQCCFKPSHHCCFQETLIHHQCRQPLFRPLFIYKIKDFKGLFVHFFCGYIYIQAVNVGSILQLLDIFILYRNLCITFKCFLNIFHSSRQCNLRQCCTPPESGLFDRGHSFWNCYRSKCSVIIAAAFRNGFCAFSKYQCSKVFCIRKGTFSNFCHAVRYDNLGKACIAESILRNLGDSGWNHIFSRSFAWIQK